MGDRFESIYARGRGTIVASAFLRVLGVKIRGRSRELLVAEDNDSELPIAPREPRT